MAGMAIVGAGLVAIVGVGLVAMVGVGLVAARLFDLVGLHHAHLVHHSVALLVLQLELALSKARLRRVSSRPDQTCLGSVLVRGSSSAWHTTRSFSRSLIWSVITLAPRRRSWVRVRVPGEVVGWGVG